MPLTCHCLLTLPFVSRRRHLPNRTLSLVVVLACLLAPIWARAAELPGYAQVRQAWTASDRLLLDRRGRLLQEVRVDPRGRRTEWIGLDQISPALVAAVLHAEDRRFARHGGVDWLSVGKAALTNWLADRPRGASTISMQLAALLDPGLRGAAGRRDMAEKWRQMAAGQALEDKWRKDQILEVYLNLLPWRGELVGVDAASRGLFDKRPDGLDAAEALVLAALIPAPNARPAQVADRACALAADLKGAPACTALRALTLNTLGGRASILPRVDLAPHAARLILPGQPGPPLRSSLDRDVQQHLRTLLAEQLDRLAQRQVEDAAGLVVDNASGQVLAYVSLSSAASASPQSDGVRARRQAGSTLKPFLYALALERRLLTAASPLTDTPQILATAGGPYAPRNYDHGYRQWASLRLALAGSLNVPAVATAQLVGPETFAQRLSELGFDGVTEAGDFYGPSLALGTADVSLWELARAYRTLANGGQDTPLSLSPDTPSAPEIRRMDPQAAWLVADILADRQARAITFGLESPLATRPWTTVKTGTSKDMRDNWCVGFSDRYTVAVWVGNFSGAPMHDVSGIQGAAPVWAALMDHLHRERLSRPLPPPAGLEAHLVRPPGEPPRREWFLAGTAPAALEWLPATPPARILRPADGAIYALDPDRTVQAQVLRFTAEHAPDGSRWELDGQPLDSPDWSPRPGRRVLRLMDTGGQVLDQVRFEVRG